MECFSLILVCTCSLRPLGLQTGKLTVCQTEFFHSYCWILILSGVYLSELDIIYEVLQSNVYLLDAGETLSSVLYDFLFLHLTHNNIYIL